MTTPAVSNPSYAITIDDVLAAEERIQSFIHQTPVLTCEAVNQRVSLSSSSSSSVPVPRIYFKCEIFQKSGSFKARGASNAVASLLPEEAAKGVCTHSSGNHAGALAVAAQLRNIPAYIVMPSNAPVIKKVAVQNYKGVIYDCEPNQAAREKKAKEVQEQTGAIFVHPSEDKRVIAGQGTIAIELLFQILPLRNIAILSTTGGGTLLQHGTGSSSSTIDKYNQLKEYARSLPQPLLNAVVIPIGGGGMISGMATVIKDFDPRILVIAAEPIEANDAYRSKIAGTIQTHPNPPRTIADGLMTTLGPNSWPIVRDKVDHILCVTEEEIIDSMRLIYERMKLVIEPSAAVGVAVIFGKDIQNIPGIVLDQVGVVLCGGNVNLDSLPFLKK